MLLVSLNCPFLIALPIYPNSVSLNEKKILRFYAEIVTDITTRNSESKDTFIIGQHKTKKNELHVHIITIWCLVRLPVYRVHPV
jgi:hypothetical protein